MYMSSGYPPRGGYGGAQPAPAGDAWQGLSQLMQQAQMIDITNAKSHLMDVQSNSGNKPTSPWCLTPRLNTLSFSDGEFFYTCCFLCSSPGLEYFFPWAFKPYSASFLAPALPFACVFN